MIFTIPLIVGVSTITTTFASCVTYPCIKKKIKRRMEIRRMRMLIENELENMDEDSMFFMILQTTPEGIPEPLEQPMVERLIRERQEPGSTKI